jgi:hypothetical protein
MPMKGPLPNKLGTTLGVPPCDDESATLRGVLAGEVLEESSLWGVLPPGLGLTDASCVYPRPTPTPTSPAPPAAALLMRA